MSVDVYECDRPVIFERTEDRNGDAVIAAKRDRHSAGCENLPDCRFGPLEVSLWRMNVQGDIADVDQPDFPVVEECSADVEIVPVVKAMRLAAQASYCIGR